MEALDEVTKALSKLRDLRAKSTTGPAWMVLEDQLTGGGDETAPAEIRSGDEYVILGGYGENGEYQEAVNKGDAGLIVALHRTIDPMIALLDREAKRLLQTVQYSPGAPTPESFQLVERDGMSFEDWILQFPDDAATMRPDPDPMVLDIARGLNSRLTP